MWLILMIIAVFLLVAGVLSVLKKTIDGVKKIHSVMDNDASVTIERKIVHASFWYEYFMIAVGLSYLIWYCN